MRLHLRLSDSAEGLIVELTEKLNVAPKEIVIDSLALYDLAVAEIAKGSRLGVQSPDGRFIAIATPTLQRLVRHPEDQATDNPVPTKAATRSV